MYLAPSNGAAAGKVGNGAGMQAREVHTASRLMGETVKDEDARKKKADESIFVKISPMGQSKGANRL